ncbi:MAG: MarR family transcriptional regulator [Candidatus Marinimicrobia bacterium]|jgi:DNA-binding MarR family transcriptional regulator|nr:MarR family transcriptional regulator [Candidatus Neomarinimicrobiota bacterium]
MAENHALTEIEKRTGFLVYRTARGMKKMLDSELNKYSVSSSQYTVLNTLMEDDGLSLSEIGKRVSIDKPAVTGIADRMEKDGLVERRRTSQDRRVIQLFMTEKGRALAEKTEGIATQIDQKLVNVLTPAEVSQFRHMLNRIWESANGS